MEIQMYRKERRAPEMVNVWVNVEEYPLSLATRYC